MIRSPFPDIPIDTEATFDKFIRAKLENHRSSVAVIDAETGRKYTYSDLLDMVDYFSKRFAKLDFSHSDVISLCLFNCIEIFPIAIAATSFGYVFNTSNPSYTVDELVYQYNLVKSACIVTRMVSIEKIRAVKLRCPHVKHVIILDGDVEGCLSIEDMVGNHDSLSSKTKVSVTVKSTDTAFLFSSSGTTGLPKQIMLTHLNLVANLCQLSPCTASGGRNMEMFSPKIGDVVLSVFPYFHLAGLLNGLVWVLKEGGCSIILPKYDTKLFLRVVEQLKPNILIAPPPVSVFLTKSLLAESADLSSIKTVVNRAAPIAPSVVRALCSRLNMEYVINGYGMTELSTIGLIVPVSELSSQKLGSCGVPLRNSVCKVVDETGNTLDANKRGELMIKGQHVTKGYLYNEAATREALTSDGWLKTGDICYYDEDGFFYIVDRIKELIKVKGFQVAPAEIEQCLLCHPDVADTAVVGILDEYAGELPFAFVVKKDGAAVDGAELQNYVADRLANYKRLTGGVRFVESIPKNPSGKILRRLLRDQIRDELAQVSS